ncbi:HAMP domain-containing sensor histidine kinase [Amycolatopsis endophytica]|uniref:Signal transduction histidine-protein kinase/phosphatase MprB n=1 Tax=Amycolatopsis endophytica TaxID=860233 RepID=A0A853B8X5_9PSEU|nr:HAMP domain-containing sensor histidine kinase [Amycolatopsis endophytica]NYI91141.1 two-component system sensor histidine kinase MtrB [Amycolatopsis endophytica]
MIRRIPLRLRGIRARLVMIISLVAVVAIVGATGVNYVAARRTVLAAKQDQEMTRLRDAVDTLAPDLMMPPDRATLEEIVRLVPGAGGVFYGTLRAGNGFPVSEVPAELVARVRADHLMVFQRVTTRWGEPVLFVGMPVMALDTNFRQVPTGIEVYARYSLVAEQQQIAEFAFNGWRTAAVAVPLAVILAWLAAGAVLRPVRRLRDGARSLARGELSTRLPDRGGDELADLARTFNDTAASLEKSVGELRRMEADARRFVADVSHELRTPLTAMTAVTEVLDEEGAHLPGDTGTASRLVSAETRKLARLVDDLIEISRFDNGRARMDRREADLGELIAATLRNRHWDDQVETDLPAGIVAQVDARRFDVVVANLVGNALRHGAPPVRVRLSGTDGEIVVEVTDRGPGLPEDVLPHVFARFYKADTARSRSEGSGLGLSIAEKNAGLHGGTIEAGNRPGGGARFVLRLPRAEVRS